MTSPLKTIHPPQAPNLEDRVPATACVDMAAIRQEIDRVDRLLVGLLAERLTYIVRAGIIKADRNKVRDEARIQDVLSKVQAACEREGFPYAIAEPVWRALMEGCIAHEFEVWDRANPAEARIAGE
jgi:isochorismate pyruvate lyase